MASRGHAFIRGLYANAQSQSFNNLMRRTGSEALAAVDHQAKRKRSDEDSPGTTSFNCAQQNVFMHDAPIAFDAELSNFLFDEDNKCIFDDECESPSSVKNISNKIKRCRYSPSRMQVQVPSEAVASAQTLVTVNIPNTVTRKITTAPVVKPKTTRKRTHKERVKKNSRERIRRAGMGMKFKELYNLVCSGMVASAISMPASSTVQAMQQQAEMERLRKVKVAKPSKVLVLSEAIKTIHSLEKELNDLKKLNNELKSEHIQ